MVLAPFCSLEFMFIVYKKKGEGSRWIGGKRKQPLLRIKSAGGVYLCVWIGDLELRQVLLGRSLDKFLFVYVQLIKMGVRSISVLDNEGPVFWRK